MRNPLRTFRKKSLKPLSRKKQGALNEKLFEAQLALDKWFADYMSDLHSESGKRRNEADLESLREMVKYDKRIDNVGLASVSRATR